MSRIEKYRPRGGFIAFDCDKRNAVVKRLKKIVGLVTSATALTVMTASSSLHSYPVQTDQTGFPEFSWDTIPRWVICGSADRISDVGVNSIANNYSVAVYEKVNYQGFQFCEDGALDLAARVKAVNSNIKNLYYWNAYIRWNGYLANVEFDSHPGWIERIDSVNRTIYKTDRPAMRNWWRLWAKAMAISDDMDGVFVDALLDQDRWGVPMFDTSGLPVTGTSQMLYDLYNDSTIPSSKLIVGNGAFGGDWLSVLDGGYTESWNGNGFNELFDNTGLQIIANITNLRAAQARGKMVLVKTTPSMNTVFTGETQPDTLALQLDYVERNVDFPLAVFLMIAEDHAYFSYQQSANAAFGENYKNFIWDTSYMDVFNKPLGEPLGDPVKNGYLYTRSFEYLDVSVNVLTGATSFQWYTTPRSATQLVQVLKRNASGFCLNGGNNGANGQNVSLWSYIAGHVNLTWEEIDRGDGYYSYQKQGTNYSLDGGDNGANNQNVYLWTTNASNYNQHWKKVDMGNGYYQLQKRNDLNYCINGGSGGANNKNVSLWSSSSGSYNLQWSFDYQ